MLKYSVPPFVLISQTSILNYLAETANIKWSYYGKIPI